MRQWWAARTVSERRLLTLGLLVLGAALYFLLVLEPLADANARHRTRLAAARDLHRELAAIGAEARALRGRQDLRTPFDAGSSLLSVVNASAARAGTQTHTRRISPIGPAAVALYLDAVPFERLARWLVTLDVEHGVEVERANLERARGGVVNAQLTLRARGADGSPRR